MVRRQTSNTTKKIDVYRRLKDSIQFLDLKPGSPINEAELVLKMGVSRTPIREALIRLSDELLVEIYPQRGTYVSKIDLALVKEMAYMRHVLEQDICLDLCKRKVDISKLVDMNLHSMDYAVKNQDIVGYVKLDDEFHRLLFSYDKHEVIWDVISNMRSHYVRVLMLDMGLPNSLEESYRDHQMIVECIRNGNEEGLLNILNTHHDHSNMKREEQIKRKYSEYFIEL